ncbi:transcriptional regulator domain-containing protein [Hirsutella rhossiliensis]|uniref:Transcriptional regulator domain-containing protein n=1 Tax=Hirsutella rhossiliensis TaxID=111463 RepID=A0A9P8SHH1_9HYPO|nr:transcriptional regulator domain-containing protein [Hirsutella rhossiliensis]KAH0963093.1 transcriptional regulator domain-containing protein [Hirsutella rhossiliensis]
MRKAPAASERLAYSVLAPLRSASSPTSPIVCRQCLLRSFATTAAPLAGHNKWSKTKHIKAVTDKKKMSERTAFTKLIAIYSRMYGEDIKFNPRMANVIAAATKASVPKSLVEAAIARGQGRSVTGAQLQAMTMEVLLPPNLALIADIETDNRQRTWNDVRYAVKKNGGVTGSTAFFFSRRGRILLKPKRADPTLSDMIEAAIELDGTDDIERLPDGVFLVWTQPTSLMAITEALSDRFELEVLDSDIIWAPNADTTVFVESQDMVESLEALLSGIREFPEVKAVFANVRQGGIAFDEWGRVARLIDG